MLGLGLGINKIQFGGSGATPISILGDDLLKWMDASDPNMTILDPINGGYVWYDKSRWVDGPQMSFIPAESLTSPSVYSNDTIIFSSANTESLWLQNQATFYNRSTGEWWFVIDHVPGTEQGLWVMTDQANDNVLFAILIFNNRFRFSTAIGGAFTITDTTTVLTAGRNVIRFGSIGASFIYDLNGVDLSNELTNNDGRFENIYDWDRAAINQKASPTPAYFDTRIKQLVRTKPLTSTKSDNLFKYLRTK